MSSEWQFSALDRVTLSAKFFKFTSLFPGGVRLLLLRGRHSGRRFFTNRQMISWVLLVQIAQLCSGVLAAKSIQVSVPSIWKHVIWCYCVCVWVLLCDMWRNRWAIGGRLLSWKKCYTSESQLIQYCRRGYNYSCLFFLAMFWLVIFVVSSVISDYSFRCLNISILKKTLMYWRLANRVDWNDLAKSKTFLKLSLLQKSN
jgi:hypothetical protein